MVKNDLIVSICTGLDSGFKTVMTEPKTILSIIKSVNAQKQFSHIGRCKITTSAFKYIMEEIF